MKNNKILEDKLMERLFDQKIMTSVLNARHTDINHNKKNNTTITLINRVIDSNEPTDNASVFLNTDDEKQEVIENAIMDTINDIIPWLKSNTKNRLTLNSTQDKTIGHGISNRNGTIKEFNTRNLTIVLEKDDNNLAGFKCVTAYPDISKYAETATPTGRNLLPDLIQTRTFKHADRKQRIQLINAVNKGLKADKNEVTRTMRLVYCYIIAHQDFNPDTMTISCDHQEIFVQDKSNDSSFSLTKNERQFNGPRDTLGKLEEYAYKKRIQYLPDTTQTSKQNNSPKTQIKKPTPNDLNKKEPEQKPERKIRIFKSNNVPDLEEYSEADEGLEPIDIDPFGKNPDPESAERLREYIRKTKAQNNKQESVSSPTPAVQPDITPKNNQNRYTDRIQPDGSASKRQGFPEMDYQKSNKDDIQFGD